MNKFIQVYAPINVNTDKEMEWFYDHVNTATQQTTTNFTILKRNINAKICHKQDDLGFVYGPLGYGDENERGNTFIEFRLQQRLYVMNKY